MGPDMPFVMSKEISCRITRTLLMYVREKNNGSIGNLLDGLSVGEGYLSDPDNWVSHAFLQQLYKRMVGLLGDGKAVYNMALASERFQSLGILDRIVRLLGNPRHIYLQAPRYNRFLKLNGSVFIHDRGDSWVVLEDRYHDAAQKTRFDCDYTRGILAGIPTIFGLPMAEVEEVKCQVTKAKYGRRVWPDSPPQGSQGCLYRVRWVSQKAAFLKRMMFRQDHYRQAIEDLVKANQRVQAKYDEIKRLMASLEVKNRQLHESKKALEAQKAELIESESKYRNLFENGSDLLCIHDLEGNLLETNLHYKEKYGWHREELEGLNIRQLMPDRHKPKLDQYLARIVANGSDDGYVKGYTKSGEEIILEYRNTLVLDENGQPCAVQGAARDVTQRFRYENELRESKEKYKELIKSVPAGICEFDYETMKFTSVNDLICETTGYSQDEFKVLDPYALLTEESQETLNRSIEKVFRDHPRGGAAEYTVIGKDNRTHQVLVRFRVFYKNDVPKRSLAVVHDITEARRTEDERRTLEKKLQNAKKLESLGALAGGVAHDLNNILSGIVSYPDLLLMDIDAHSPLRKPLLDIKKSGQKAAAIVQDLLTLARRNVASKRVVDINRIISDFMATPEYLRIVKDRDDITTHLNLSDDLLNVLGAEAQLSKTLMNLVDNAVDAMPSGGDITIATRACYLDQPHMGFEVVPQGEYAIMEISDAGIGIAPSDLNRIFDPFYTKKAMGRSGTGLGMSVIWGTVKDHEGFIDVATAESRGTTFTVYFPVSRKEIDVSLNVCIDDYLGKGESILIVDDSEEQRELVKRMMTRIGYVVDTAASGVEAVKRVQSTPFDILILDMIMPPGIDGLETYRQILEIVPGQKAIIASGYSRTESVQEAQQLGAGRYIKKPFTLEKIGLAVRNELNDD